MTNMQIQKKIKIKKTYEPGIFVTINIGKEE